MKKLLTLLLLLPVLCSYAQLVIPQQNNNNKPLQRPLVYTGTLKIVSNASGSIKIDGENKGSIEENGVRKFELRTGDYIVQLFPGDGRKAVNEEVTIKAEQTETVKLEVKEQKPIVKTEHEPVYKTKNEIDGVESKKNYYILL